MRTITILLIEDNTQDIRLIREMLKEIRYFNYNLETAATLKEGCEQIQRNNFDIILLDLNLPDSTGQQTFQKVIDCNNEIPVVLITGMEDEKLSLKLIMEGAQDYITKQSLNPDLLGKSILYSIERQALLRNIKIQNVQIARIEKERILIAKLPSQDPDPILRVAGNGKLLYINEAGIKLLPDWQLIINEIIPSRLKDIIDSIFIEGPNIEFELCHREFIYSFYAVPFIEEGYINLYGRDITARKNAELERAKMNTDLIQRNKDLEQFSYIVSHNLRAPVANIIGLSAIAQDENLEPDMKKEVVEGLSLSVKKLDDVIIDLNNILQAKLEVSQKKEMVHFSKIANDIHLSIENLIKKEKAVLVRDFSEVDEMITVKSHLHSIFYNLISNSLKYRRPDVPLVIEIKSRKLKDKIELIFKDNGMGIDLEKEGDQVFGLYKRFHTESAEGKGMGLYMVKTQVETLGGKISISSEVNKGTEFKIEFEI